MCGYVTDTLFADLVFFPHTLPGVLSSAHFLSPLPLLTFYQRGDTVDCDVISYEVVMQMSHLTFSGHGQDVQGDAEGVAGPQHGGGGAVHGTQQLVGVPVPTQLHTVTHNTHCSLYPVCS